MSDSSRPDHLHRCLLRRDVERVAPHVRGRLLDIGCGSQPYRGLLGPRVERYVGFDLPPERWQRASTRADVYGRGPELPFSDRSFDTVVCFQVLEHVPEPWRIVDQAARVLRPGGCLILTTPQHFHVHGAPEDFFRFTRHGLIALAERAELLPLECTEQGGGWVTVSESLLQYFTRHYWRTLRRPGLARALCRLGNRVFAWLDRRFPYPDNPCNLTLVARRPA
jgi:SAM-dependent methyltransferase